MKMNYLLRAILVAALLLSIPPQAQWVTAPISWETFAHTAVVQGDQLWIIGGTDPGTGGPINDIQVFDIPSTSMIESIQGQGAGGYHSTVVGDSGVYVLGGFGSLASITPVISDTMKVYSNGTWSYTLLPDVIGGAAAVAVQGKIIVGGGYKALTWNSNNQAIGTFSSDVYIYDEATGSWSTEQLSQARAFLAAATDGQKLAFAGGHSDINETSDVVDWYDLSTGTWTTDQLSQNRSNLSAEYTQGKFYFAGGTVISSTQSSVIDIWDGTSWTAEQLNEARALMGSAVVGGQ